MQPETIERCDIAIIGGGLVGASLALALQQGAVQRGWRIVMIEPVAPQSAYQPSFDARSSAISYGSRLLYERLGLWQQIAERAEPMTHIEVSEQGSFGVTHLDAAAEGVPALGYVVENAWLGHCLIGALEAGHIERRCPAVVSSMQPLADGYLLSFDDGSQLHTSLAALADGGRSGLAKSLGIEHRREPYGQAALIANLETATPHQGRAFERFTANGPMAFLPMSGNRGAIVWTRSLERAEELLQAPAEVFLAALQEEFGYALGLFGKLGKRYMYPLAKVLASEQVRPHLVLLGNSAHSLHPVAGQGFNLSLRDLMALADALLASPSAPGDVAVLQDYTASREQDQWRVVNFSHAMPLLFGKRQAWWRLGRNLGLLALDMMPPAKHWFARQSMGLIE